MRVAWCLVGLLACGAQAPPAAAPCPTCPTADCPTYPDIPCPTVPAPTPVTPAPTPRDWHCFDIHRPSGYVSSFCYPGAQPCEEVHAEAVDGRYGKVAACTTQRTAACFQLAVPSGLARQLRCARTLEGCRVRRTDIKGTLRPSSSMSECKMVLNIDDYRDHTDFGLPVGTP